MRCLLPCLLAELIRRFPVSQLNQRFALGHLPEVAEFIDGEHNRIQPAGRDHLNSRRWIEAKDAHPNRIAIQMGNAPPGTY